MLWASAMELVNDGERVTDLLLVTSADHPGFKLHATSGNMLEVIQRYKPRTIEIVVQRQAAPVDGYDEEAQEPRKIPKFILEVEHSSWAYYTGMQSIRHTTYAILSSKLGKSLLA